MQFDDDDTLLRTTTPAKPGESESRAPQVRKQRRRWPARNVLWSQETFLVGAHSGSGCTGTNFLPTSLTTVMHEVAGATSAKLIL